MQDERDRSCHLFVDSQRPNRHASAMTRQQQSKRRGIPLASNENKGRFVARLSWHSRGRSRYSIRYTVTQREQTRYKRGRFVEHSFSITGSFRTR